jgi:streptomycin 6-kinase
MIYLDPVAAALAKQWGFEPFEELPGGHCSHVYASHDKVLKVPFQGEEMTSGYWAMIHQTGDFAPTIFQRDPVTGSMLMERAMPGTKLHESGIDEAEQLRIWAQIAHQFHTISTQNLMPMEAYANRQDRLVNHLLATTERASALHGDLHHENILKHQNGWMCIDAKGLIGDPAIEGAAFVCNPWPEFGDFTATQFIHNVIVTANALKVEPFRVWGWSVARMREDPPTPGEPSFKALPTLLAIADQFGGQAWI